MAGLNKVILMGNLVADPVLKVTPTGVNVCSFSIAVARRFAKPEDEVKADFFNIIAWRGAGEFVSKYFVKGKAIAIVGSLQNRSFITQAGEKKYITEIIADECTFAGNANGEGAVTSKAEPSDLQSAVASNAVQSTRFEDIPDDGELPL